LSTNGYVNYVTYAKSHEEFRNNALKIFEEKINPYSVDVLESPEVGACAYEIKKKYPHIPLLVRLHTPGVIITKISNHYQSLAIKLRYVLGALRRGRIDLGYWNLVDRNRESDKEFQICNIADQLISPSYALQKAIHTIWKINPNKIKVVPNPFIPNSNFYPAPIILRQKLICFVGKLSTLKGMYIYTKAIKKILKKNTDYSALFIGKDTLMECGKKYFSEWMQNELDGFLDRVSFLGSLDSSRVYEYLLKSRIVVVPSLWENYPMILFEAMSAGCAVVATNRGGVPEIIKDKINGLLINPFDTNDIIQKIHLLISDDNILVQLSEASSRYVLEKNNSSFEKEIENIYTVLANNS